MKRPYELSKIMRSMSDYIDTKKLARMVPMMTFEGFGEIEKRV